MKLVRVRVQNYKNIEDSSWVDCGDLTVFVGKNESGKTAFLRGLSKLKPTDNSTYDPIKEFPHSRYTDEFKKRDWPVGSGVYELNDSDRSEIEEICPLLKETQKTTVTRHYSGRHIVQFEPEPENETPSPKQWLDMLGRWKKKIMEMTAPDGQGTTWAPVKDKTIGFLDRQETSAQDASFRITTEIVEAVQKSFATCMTEQWMTKSLNRILEELNCVKEKLDYKNAIEKARNWVIENIPYFLYFGEYEVLESAIYLPEFVQRINSGDKSPRTRVQLALFKHVGADVKELSQLGRHQPGPAGSENPTIRRQIDELNIKANSASMAMTKKFSDWWEQRRHEFQYRFYGDYFRIWVSDNLSASEVELEERSKGLRYFFSFYLLFLVEAEDEHRDCILLLDEPGLHLHGTAQAKLIEFLEKISGKNQALYTTHSPFMIDGSRLDRARAVFESPEGTIVTSDVWPKDRDTLFPLQAALGYSVCQSLFVSKRQVMVEGPTDYTLLTILNHKLVEKGGKGLREDVLMIPMGGVTNLAPLASMLIGHDIEIAILLDSDPAGIGAMKKIRSLLSDVDKRCILVSKFGDPEKTKELEDLIPEAYYLDALERAYPACRFKFNAAEQKIEHVTDRVKAFFTRNELGVFEKWRPIQKIVEDINSNKNAPKEIFDIGEKVFNAINSIFSES